MPLPENPRANWPPDPWKPIIRDIGEAAAWYQGDEDTLAGFYGGINAPRTRRARFWSRRRVDQMSDRQRLHIPAAADIAAASADLLFGETPDLTIADAHATKADSAAKATQDRLAELVEINGIASTLLEGAEICSALGGVYLRPLWDPEVAQHPLLTVIHSDYAIPDFRWGHLMAVTFWRDVLRDGGKVWRHLERHESGVIYHGLYMGDTTTLGARQPLEALPAMHALSLDEGSAEMLTLPAGIDGLDVRYVPNVRPNRKHRGLPIGRSDTQGTETLMDSIDEVYSSWMRDIRLGKMRIIVPNEFLERRGRGRGAGFDEDQEVFSPLEIDPANKDKAGINPIEFKIRTQEHADTAFALFEQITRTAGYSPQTFGIAGGESEKTATEVRAKQGRSQKTTSRKHAYWEHAIEDVTEIMLIIDREIFGSKIEPMRPRLDWPDGVPVDPQATATTISLLNQAQAASIETRVRMANPQLDEDEVVAEVARIKDEAGIAVNNPTGAPPPPPAPGDPNFAVA